MKRVVIVILIIIFVALCGVGIYFGVFQGVQNPPVYESGENSGDVIVENQAPSEKIEVTTSYTKTTTNRREVNVEMPTIKGLSDYTFQEIVNKKIAESINPYVMEIGIVADETIPAGTKYYYTVSYERYNNGDYISLVVLQNYSTGGMRSNVWKDTYTIDVVNNREILLADICSFKDYKKVIVDEINRQAAAKKIELVAGNGLADLPDTQRFYIKDEKLYIYFEPASIAPYLDGEMHFEMPFSFVDGRFVVE